MGGISDEHVEWAVVFRLASMLGEPQHRIFDVTHTYALFVPILCWTMQRMRQNNPQGRVLQNQLRGQKATDRPWLLPLNKLHSSLHETSPGNKTTINGPGDWPIEPFLIALRNSVAHGDARNVFPFHRQVGSQHELVGFTFRCKVAFSTIEKRSFYGKPENSAIWQSEITLQSEDMRRIGYALAHKLNSVRQLATTDRTLSKKPRR